MKIGAHESIAGGLHLAFERGDENRGETLQIFTVNGSRWVHPPRNPDEVSAFRSAASQRRIPLLAHDSYLINLAAAEGEIHAKSMHAFQAELARCDLLGIDFLVMHPGAHVGIGVEAGIERFAANLTTCLRAVPGQVRVLIELTAGQGTCLGSTFEELRAILDLVDDERRMGVCFDTCHALAAGYDYRTREGYETMWAEFDAVLGFERLFAFHLNDSKTDCGSHVDRHEEIGKGFVGEEPFGWLMRDPRFAALPGIVELPPSVVGSNLAKLRALRTGG